ncbi:MAG: (2Fe-2S)-binding protein [Oceanicaulis sp.]
MIVCVCNVIRCRDVKAAAEKGVSDVPGVFKACGAKPKCGRCFEEAAKMIGASVAAAAAG